MLLCWWRRHAHLFFFIFVYCDSGLVFFIQLSIESIGTMHNHILMSKCFRISLILSFQIMCFLLFLVYVKIDSVLIKLQTHYSAFDEMQKKTCMYELSNIYANGCSYSNCRHLYYFKPWYVWSWQIWCNLATWNCKTKFPSFNFYYHSMLLAAWFMLLSLLLKTGCNHGRWIITTNTGWYKRW